MSFIRFLFSKYFFINIAIYLVLILVSIWGVLNYLDGYTLHNQTITLPDLRGYHTKELDSFLNDKKLHYVVIDSVYELDALPGAVIDQNPLPGAQVKENRKVYVTINANSPKKIQFPDLRDVTLRQATAILETFNIKIDSLKYKPDPCVKCVLDVVQDTTYLEPGDMIKAGSSVVLVLGSGLSDEFIEMPILINMQLSEAQNKLKELGLNLGAFNYEDCLTADDTVKAKVFKQIPAYNTNELIQLGQSVVLFFTSDSTKIPEIISDSLQLENGYEN